MAKHGRPRYKNPQVTMSPSPFDPGTAKRLLDSSHGPALEPDGLDILPALKGEDSPKGIFRLRVSSVLKDAFAWNVEGRHRVVTNGVLFSACSPVNRAFLPAYSRHQRRRVLQPAR
jgi:hypothetical protein